MPAKDPAVAFGEELFGDADGFVLVWTLPDKQSRWWPASEVGDAMRAAAELGVTSDVYVGAGLRACPHGDTRRGGSADVTAITALWADIDDPPDVALPVLENLEVPPSVVVGSGSGIHAWWLLAEPFATATPDERTEAETLLRRVHADLRARGLHVDHVHDLARVMRVPGTVNHKHGAAVEGLAGISNGRLILSDFEHLDDVPPPSSNGSGAPVEAADLSADEVDAIAAALAAGSERFARTWNRARGDLADQSASSYDLAVASAAVAAGLDDGVVAALLARWRTIHGEDPAKVTGRGDYAARTIARAHGPESDAIEKLRVGASACSAASHLPDEFWNARGYLEHIRRAAHSRQRSADAVLHAVLARVAAFVPHTLELPPIVGKPAPLCHFAALVAPPGVGKTSANGIAYELLPLVDERVADHLPIGSGEGLVEVLFDYVREDDENGKAVEVKRQTRFGAFVYIDEGQMLTELGGRSGSTVLHTLRTIWSGDTIGNTNASRERKRVVPAGQYTYGVVLGLQDKRAGALLDGADDGTPQRFMWARATDPTIPDAAPEWPGPLPWAPPAPHLLDRVEVNAGPFGRHRLRVDDAIVEELRVADRARARGVTGVDPLDAHAGLLRCKAAGLLGVLDGRVDVNLEDWRLGGMLARASAAVRADLVSVTAVEAAEREAATSRRLAHRAAAADEAVATRRTVDLARKLARRVHAEPNRWTVRELQGNVTAADRVIFDDAVDHAVAEGWVVVVEEPGRGVPRRVVHPGARTPK